MVGVRVSGCVRNLHPPLCSIPEGLMNQVNLKTPPWPSLYNLALEITPVQGTDPVQSRGRYLTHPGGKSCLHCTTLCTD